MLLPSNLFPQYYSSYCTRDPSVIRIHSIHASQQHTPKVVEYVLHTNLALSSAQSISILFSTSSDLDAIVPKPASARGFYQAREAPPSGARHVLSEIGHLEIPRQFCSSSTMVQSSRCSSPVIQELRVIRSGLHDSCKSLRAASLLSVLLPVSPV